MSQENDQPPGDRRHRLRVRYCETDRMGVTHHGSYVDWFEEARTEWLRNRGQSYRAWEAQGVFLQVVGVAIQYLHPTTFDDEVSIGVRVTERRHASFTLSYDVVLEPGGALAATGTTKLACVDADGRLRRLPAWLGD